MRIQCCVPHCSRTKSNANNKLVEWICGQHWSYVPRKKRRVWQRIRREQTKGLPLDSDRAARLWTRVKRIAIERGMGI